MTVRLRNRAPLAAVVALTLAACGGRSGSETVAFTGGDPATGAELAWAYGCGTCHTIPGVPSADMLVGPPLTEWATRSYVAGAVPNEPEHLIRWIQDPRSIEPLTAMPNLGVSEADARHIAAYLYTLQ